MATDKVRRAKMEVENRAYASRTPKEAPGPAVAAWKRYYEHALVDANAMISIAGEINEAYAARFALHADARNLAITDAPSPRPKRAGLHNSGSLERRQRQLGRFLDGCAA